MPKPLTDVLALPPIQWRIDRLLPDDGLMVIGGAPGRGKSRLGLDIARRLVQGSPLFGCLPVLQAERVLVHSVEGGLRGVTARGAMFAGMTEAEKARLFVEANPIMFTHATGQVRGQALEEAFNLWREFDLVILDPLVHFRSCDENNNQHSAALMKAIHDSARKAGCAAIVVHHARKTMKGEEPSGEQLRGASAILAEADSTIILRKRDETSVSVTFDKVRYAAIEGDLEGVALQSDVASGCFYRGGNTKDWLEDWPAGELATAFGLKGTNP